MKKFLLGLLFMTLFLANETQAQCVDCNTLICDGGLCDDGSPADGVQTSRNCGCGKEISGACATVEIDLSFSPYYNPDDPTCGLLLNAQESGNFWIYFLNNGCMPTDCSTPDFIISSGAKISMPESPVFSLMICKEGGNAGRRDFNISVSCTSVENCVNLIDDDLNGFVDCDDPGCITYCDYSATSSSGDGGLESNNRLAEKIALRKYFRAIESFDSEDFVKDYNKLAPFESQQIVFRNNPSISELTPWDAIPQAEVYNTTPVDLLQITNAEDIFAFDFIEKGKRVASVLATETSEKVYEHTKYICDRLGGSKIEEIWDFDFGTPYSFIVTKFRNPEQNVEYNCNFSLIKNRNGEFELHSHWNLYDYPQGAKIYNFQLWANNTFNLQLLIRRFLDEHERVLRVKGSLTSDSPKTYVSSVFYQNHKLEIDLKNNLNLKQFKIKGLSRRTELSSPEPFELTLPLLGNELEHLTLPFDGFYDISFEIFGAESNVRDGVYVADGAWGLDYASESATIDHYEITPNNNSLNYEGDYLVERNVKLKGKKKGSVNLFRALNAHNTPEDLTYFNELKFSAAGTGNLEIMLIHDHIEEWSDQPRVSIFLDQKEQEYTLRLSDFHTDQNLPLDAVSMLVFTQNSTSDVYENLDVSIADLRFSKSNVKNESQKSKVKIFPNPMSDGGFVSFDSEDPGPYFYQLVSFDGKVINEHWGTAIKGINTIPINNDGLTPGIYFIKVVRINKEIIVGKLMLSSH